MSTIIMITQLILGLAILVFVHELGHFFAARLFHIRVPKFYLFFNPTFSLVRMKRINGKWVVKFFAKNLPDTEIEVDESGTPIKDENGKIKHKLIDTASLPDDDWRKYPENTEYGIGWLPLGGYCQIAGMIDETQSMSNLASEPQPWEYRSKPAWQRLIVILAGVFVNMIVSVFLFALVLYHYDKKYLPLDAVTNGIYAFEAARDMGFQTGDKIISIDGKKYERFQDAVSPKLFFGSIVTVERNGQLVDIVITDEAYNIMKTNANKFILPINFPAKIDSITENGKADIAGLKSGDIIIALDTNIVENTVIATDSNLIQERKMPTPDFTFGTLIEYRSNYANKLTTITFIRQNDTLTTNILLDSTALVDILIFNKYYETKSYTIGQSFKYGWSDAFGNIWLNMKGLGKIFSGEESAKSLSGPIGIAQIYGTSWIWERFWYITALLSAILAFMNILPIPGLDGGHALFTIVEMLTGKKVSDNVLQYAQTIGMIILLLLMIFVIGNDIFKLFG